MRTIVLFLIILFTLFSFSGCGQEKKYKIALSKGKGSQHYVKYSQWLESLSDDIVCIDLYHINLDSAVKVLENCAGLVLTGGPDVDPNRYGKAYDSTRCDIDYKRDTLEYALLKRALALKMPVLAICRGEQIFNVYHNGTLIVDIPSDFDTSIIHRYEFPKIGFHNAKIKEGSLIRRITNASDGKVNTYHHQAVDRISNELVPTVFTDDGLIEAYEWKESLNKSFLIAVQWHPERLEKSNPLSNPLGISFLARAIGYYGFKLKY